MSDRMTVTGRRPIRTFLAWSPVWTPVWACTIAAGLGLFSGCNLRKPGPQAESGSQPDPVETQRQERFEIDLFAFGRQLGTVAPCGCTTDPLGGLQFAFGYIEAQSTAGQRLILEPGSFLFPDPDGPEAPTDEAAWAQAGERARLLHERFAALDGLVSGLGPTDYADPQRGAAALGEFAMPRVLANLGAGGPAEVSSLRLLPLGRGLEAAVTVVLDPALAETARGSWAASFPAIDEPLPALQKLQPELAKADLQIVVVHGPRELAESVARELEGVDVVVMAGVLDNPDRARLGSAPVQIGKAWLLEPGDRAQTISHLTLSLDPKLPEGTLPADWTLLPSPQQLAAELARLEEKLAKFADDPSADAGFIARLQADREQLKQQLEDPSIPDDVAAAVVTAQTKVSCRLPHDEAAEAALHRYDGWVAERNRERFAGVKAPAPKPGEAGFVGIDACADCHEEAVTMWKTTVHAGAYQSLVAANKQYDLSCVNCHVTGFRQVGGSEVVENHNLQAIQCEQCHGPGSLHVADPTPDNIQLEAPREVCLACHTPEHSDTFDYEPYLRDILGEGHGPEARAKLGEGKTGRALRQAGLEAAGGSCPKM